MKKYKGKFWIGIGVTALALTLSLLGVKNLFALSAPTEVNVTFIKIEVSQDNDTYTTIFSNPDGTIINLLDPDVASSAGTNLAGNVTLAAGTYKYLKISISKIEAVGPETATNLTPILAARGVELNPLLFTADPDYEGDACYMVAFVVGTTGVNLMLNLYFPTAAIDISGVAYDILGPPVLSLAATNAAGTPVGGSISGTVTNLDPVGSYTEASHNVMVGAFTKRDPDGMPLFGVVVEQNEGDVTVDYTISGLPAGTYYVYACQDIDGDFEPTFTPVGEPVAHSTDKLGQHQTEGDPNEGDTPPVPVAENQVVTGKNIPVGYLPEEWCGGNKVWGVISYNQEGTPVAGDLHIGICTKNFMAEGYVFDENDWVGEAHTSLPEACTQFDKYWECKHVYVSDAHPHYPTYYVAAFLDANGNEYPDAGDWIDTNYKDAPKEIELTAGSEDWVGDVNFTLDFQIPEPPH